MDRRWLLTVLLEDVAGTFDELRPFKFPLSCSSFYWDVTFGKSGSWVIMRDMAIFLDLLDQ